MPRAPRGRYGSAEGKWQGEGLVEQAMALLDGWGLLVVLIVVFAVIYRVGAGGLAATSSTRSGCLAAVVITVLFFVFVIF